MKKLFAKSALAALAVVASAVSLSALPSPAPDDNDAADYKIRSVTPENYTQIEELSTITILYDMPANGWSPAIREDYAPDLWNPEQPYKKLVVTRNGKQVSTLSVEGCYVSYGPTTLNLIFSLDTPQTDDGTYEIVIPDRYVIDGANYTTGKKTLRYQIGDDSGEVEPDPEVPETGYFRLESISPSVGELTPELSFITAQWLDSNDQPCVWNGPNTLLLKAKDPEGNLFTVDKANVDAGNGKVFFTLNRAYSTFGTVYLTIPAGAIASADGSESNQEEIVLDYPIYYEGSFNMNNAYPAAYGTVDGNSGQSIENIAIFYAQSVSVGTGDLPYMISENGEIYDASGVSVPTIDTTQALIRFDGADLLKKGRYTVVVPRNAIGGSRGLAFYYNFVPVPGQEIPEVPEGTKLEILKCTISGYDMLDPENGIPALTVDAPMVIETNLDYASDVCWYKILDVTDCKSDLEYDRAPAIHTSYFDKSGGHFSGPILSPGGLIRNLTSDRLYVVQAHTYLNYYNANLRRDWGYAYSAVFRGGAKPYEYAECNLSVVPVPGSELKDGEPVVMTFDRPVNFVTQYSGIPQGQDGTLPLKASCNTDKTVWTFNLPESAFSDSKVEVHFGFTDVATGRRIRPAAYNVPETETIYYSIFNYGSEGNSQIVVIYGSFEAKPDFQVEPDSGSRLEKLSEFKYTFADGDEIMPSWMDEAVVKDASGNVVAKVNTDELVENGGHVRAIYDSDSADAKSIALHIPLDTEITTPGIYTIEYPYGFFSKGRELSSDFTRPTSHIYEVTGNGTVGIDGISVGEEIYTVINLQGVVLLRNADTEALRSLPAGFYIVNGKKTIIK